MASKLFVLIFACGLVASALGYGAGGPKEACDTMKPEHQTDPQGTEAPYLLSVSKKAIRSGDAVTLTITGKTAADTIKGFMVQARQGNKRIGHFQVDPKDNFVQELNCDDVRASAVTHKKHDDKDDKRSLSVTWVSPKGTSAEIVFRATIVHNGGVFWVGKESDVVKVY